MTRLTHAALAHDIEAFLEFKHALGFAYVRSEKTLRSFQRFCKSCSRSGARTVDLERTCKAFISSAKGCKSFTLALYLTTLRQLCLHRRRRDPDGYVPDRLLAPNTDSHFVPYIFSHNQVRQLLKAASSPRYYACKIPSITVRVAMLILYCTGLRFGEVVRARMEDVDLNNDLLTIRESKGRTRIVPFGADLSSEIKQYLTASHVFLDSAQPRTHLLIDRRGQPVKRKTFTDIFGKLLRREGLKPAQGRAGPRPYDFRHAFAVHRLTDWYHAGVDIRARLPLLSAYMGHVNVLGTEAYLHATPELLRLASDRFHDRWKTARRGS
jgi:site-specific recombinase XerD